jgi:hypothetical protein
MKNDDLNCTAVFIIITFFGYYMIYLKKKNQPKIAGLDCQKPAAFGQTAS